MLAFKHSMETSRFRAMLLAISDKLTEDNVTSLKFLCPEVGKKKLEKVNKGIDLFECLIERAAIGPDSTELLRNHLNHIGQTVLLNIIDDYERGVTGSPPDITLPDAKERGLYTLTEHLCFMSGPDSGRQLHIDRFGLTLEMPSLLSETMLF